MKTHCPCCENTYPNDDELAFHYWLAEAKHSGHILGWQYQCPRFLLSEKETISEELEYFTPAKKIRKTKIVTETILREHTYTPDFEISEPSTRLSKMLPELRKYNPVSAHFYFDVKPSFEKYHSRAEAFRINQNWMRSKHGIFVHPVIPKDFFHRTWVPEKLAFCLNGTRRKPFADCLLVGEV